MGNAVRKRELYLVGREAQNPLRDIRYLAFGCGSIRGIALISAYWTLKEILPIDLKGMSGCSVGSVMCLAICLGLNFDDMVEFQSSTLSRNFGRKLNFRKDCNRWSFLDDKELRIALEKVILAKGFEKNFTFKDIQPKYDMRIVSFNINTKSPIIFSVHSTPNMSVLDAVCASCAIPFVFAPQQILKQCYVDGAVAIELPLYEFDLQHTLGFYLFDQFRNAKLGDEFFTNLKNKDNVISIDISKMPFLEMNPTPQMVKYILNQGRNAVLNYYHLL